MSLEEAVIERVVAAERSLLIRQFAISLDGDDSKIVDMMLCGYSMRQIAKKLKVQPAVISRHLRSLAPRLITFADTQPIYIQEELEL